MSNKQVIKTYDIIIIGAGVAGLWLGCVLKRAGYNVIVIEKNMAGAGQTLASQGMIHGGQKYTLTGDVPVHAKAIAKMPERWDACLEGFGEIDLTSVKVLSDMQVMWAAGSIVSEAAVLGAAKLVNTQTRKLKKGEFPAAFAEKKKFKGPVYALPEKVLDAKSLIHAFMRHLTGRVFKGDVTEVMPDGQIAISGQVFSAQAVIFTAGLGNEEAFKMLNIKKQHSQQRPLRQVMVRPLPHALFGHGIVANPKPRTTITAHEMYNDDPALSGTQYVWYLGGNIAEEGAKMDDAAAIAFAKSEMSDMFPDINWDEKEWATWHGVRAEPFSDDGHLPPGPHIEQRGKILVAWPVKMTFAPLLGDRISAFLIEKDIKPAVKTAPPDLPRADIANLPWEGATWVRAGE